MATSSTDAARDDHRVRRRPPEGQFGAHRYDLAEYGLDAGELAERFAGYTDRYGIAVESNRMTES